jgi:hypothetical protein
LFRIGAAVFVFVNAVLSVTDQMDVFDVAALLLNIIALSGCLYLFISGECRPPR